MSNVHYAAMINIGNNPLIGLLVLVIVVGIIVWAALWLMDNFAASVMEPRFARAARGLIIFIGVIIVLIEALSVIFGIQLFAGR